MKTLAHFDFWPFQTLTLINKFMSSPRKQEMLLTYGCFDSKCMKIIQQDKSIGHYVVHICRLNCLMSLLSLRVFGNFEFFSFGTKFWRRSSVSRFRHRILEADFSFGTEFRRRCSVSQFRRGIPEAELSFSISAPNSRGGAQCLGFGTEFWRRSADSADIIGRLLFLWYSIRWVTLLNVLSLVLTTPSGSTRRRCFLEEPCWPVSTYWPLLPYTHNTEH